MVLDLFKSVFFILLQLAIILLIPIFIIVFIVIFMTIFNIIHLYRNGIRREKGKKIDLSDEQPSFFKKIFYLLPRQLAWDFMHKKPYEFNEYGLHMFCGLQGAGKTISVVHLLLYLQKKYPNLKVRTNMHYKYQDDTLNNWQQLIKNDNGVYGQVEVLDEIQTWFSSNDSKNFPPSMLTEISQQRKQRKMLIGTAQVFSRIAKPIREQVTYVYLPRTFLGCLTIVSVARPYDYDYELNKFKRIEKRYFFVHDYRIRNAFDTYEKIERYKEVGFQENQNIFVDTQN